MPSEPQEIPPDRTEVDNNDDSERRMTWLSDGLAISQRIMVVAMSLGLPVLMGAWLDFGWRIMGNFPVGMLAGFFFGMLAAGWQLWRLTEWLSARNSTQRDGAAKGRSR